MTKLSIALSSLLLLLVTWTTLTETSAVKCCTKYSDAALPVVRLRDYRVQDLTGLCHIEAVIFSTVRGRLICANPEEKWVKDGIKYIK
ncbi:C-C motif chemokine 2 [Chanos chanos]|uniref:C-C motif chemokine n=1 Tax=Chanos chanos TaxID=29144 RepID=A0A6J2V8U7_CHACN|nr:C-C motif chemokine 2-like [Chanos chanos]